MDEQVRMATADDVDVVVAVLTDAFMDDPVLSWVFGDVVARLG